MPTALLNLVGGYLLFIGSLCIKARPGVPFVVVTDVAELNGLSTFLNVSIMMRITDCISSSMV